jgi:hypothetical protein
MNLRGKVCKRYARFFDGSQRGMIRLRPLDFGGI